MNEIHSIGKFYSRALNFLCIFFNLAGLVLIGLGIGGKGIEGIIKISAGFSLIFFSLLGGTIYSIYMINRNNFLILNYNFNKNNVSKAESDNYFYDSFETVYEIKTKENGFNPKTFLDNSNINNSAKSAILAKANSLSEQEIRELVRYAKDNESRRKY